MARFEREPSEFTEKLVSLNRVSKTVKGGRVMKFAAEVREKRPPEPYKGKGIKYTDEVIRRKAGKTGAKK